MCKEWPGPRCSNHALRKKEKAWKALTALKSTQEENSLEVKQAKKVYLEAAEEYLTTPDGIKQLEEENPELAKVYRQKRKYQLEALREIKMGRTELVSALLSKSQNFYDEEEIATVLQAHRRKSEESSLQSGIKESEDTSSTYQAALGKYEEALKAQGQFNAETRDKLLQLRQMDSPDEQNTVEVYRSMFTALSQSKTELTKEITRLATLQDVTPKVAAAYYDAYRNEYKTHYANLPAKEQPNPPTEWVEGEYNSTGYQSNNTFLAPSDPASMYAVYRLRSDSNAIPDYLKQSRILASMNINQGEGKAVVVLYNNKGKMVETLVAPTSHPPIEIANKLTGKIIVTDDDPATRSWLSGLNKQTPLNSSLLSVTDLSVKQLNVPDLSLDTLCQTTSTDINTSFEGRPVTLLEAYFTSRKIINTKWKSKSVRKNAPSLETTPLTSRWM